MFFCHHKIKRDINEKLLQETMNITVEKKREIGVEESATIYVKREVSKQSGTISQKGEFMDFPMTNGEIEALDR